MTVIISNSGTLYYSSICAECATSTIGIGAVYVVVLCGFADGDRDSSNERGVCLL